MKESFKLTSKCRSGSGSKFIVQMWKLQVNTGSSLNTGTNLLQEQCITYVLMGTTIKIGRPAKDASILQQVDICLEGDSSLSKIHCILEQHDGRLSIKGKSSRYLRYVIYDGRTWDMF